MQRGTSNQLTPAQQAKFEALLALPDEEIDTEDIPEIGDWSDGVRGMFSRSVAQQNAFSPAATEKNFVVRFVFRLLSRSHYSSHKK